MSYEKRAHLNHNSLMALGEVSLIQCFARPVVGKCILPIYIEFLLVREDDSPREECSFLQHLRRKFQMFFFAEFRNSRSSTDSFPFKTVIR